MIKVVRLLPPSDSGAFSVEFISMWFDQELTLQDSSELGIPIWNVR